MAHPYLSLNLGGGSIPLKATSSPVEPNFRPATPGPFGLLNDDGDWNILNAVPPYASGTPAVSQNLNGTMWWMVLGTDKKIWRHGWLARGWLYEATIDFLFPDGDVLELVIPPTAFGDAADLTTPPPDLTVEPGTDYEYSYEHSGIDGGSVPDPALVADLPGTISNVSGWAASAEEFLTGNKVKYRLRLNLGRANRSLTGVGRGICESIVDFQCEVGHVEETEFGSAFTPWSGGCRALSTTFWRVGASETAGPTNGEVVVQDDDGTVYSGQAMIAPTFFGGGTDLTISAAFTLRWAARQLNRADIA